MNTILVIEDNELNLTLMVDILTINGQQRHIIGYLEDFLFTPERTSSPARYLSGGERNRLLLARLFSKPSNVLVRGDGAPVVVDFDHDGLDETLTLSMDSFAPFEGSVVSTVTVFDGARGTQKRMPLKLRGTGQATPATRPAVTSTAPAANGPAIAARPATPAHPAGSVQPQAARPATAPAQGATVQGHASQAQRPAATPGTPAVPSRVN
jgi:ATP-binding cassette subfamily F protein uup